MFMASDRLTNKPHPDCTECVLVNQVMLGRAPRWEHLFAEAMHSWLSALVNTASLSRVSRIDIPPRFGDVRRKVPMRRGRYGRSSISGKTRDVGIASRQGTGSSHPEVRQRVRLFILWALFGHWREANVIAALSEPARSPPQWPS